MAPKKTLLVLLVVTLSLFIENTEAGWKFWKKRRATTPETPTTSTTTTTRIRPVQSSNPLPRFRQSMGPVANAFVGPTDSSLEIGIENPRLSIGPITPVLRKVVSFVHPSTHPRVPKYPSSPGTPSPAGKTWVQVAEGGSPPGPSVPAPRPSEQPISEESGESVDPPGPPVPAPRPSEQSISGQSGESVGPPGPSVPAPRPSEQPISEESEESVDPPWSPVPAPRPSKQSISGQSGESVGPPGPSVPAPRPSEQPISEESGESVDPGAVARGLAGGAIDAAGKKIYSSNPSYSRGNEVTDEELEKLFEALWIKDNNNAWEHVKVNLQREANSSSTRDKAPEPLLTVHWRAFEISTIERFSTLRNNYELETRENKYIDSLLKQDENLLVDTLLSTNIMAVAMRFLADKGYIRRDYYDYKGTLRRTWFNRYSTGDSRIVSTGFDNVFFAKHSLGSEVRGLHNWIYFNAEETNGRANYLGYIKKIDLGGKAAILKFHAKFSNIDKAVTTMFIGTSPELEMALYTVCFFVRSDQSCPVSLGGTKFNIITHKFANGEYDLIDFAYLEI